MNRARVRTHHSKSKRPSRFFFFVFSKETRDFFFFFVIIVSNCTNVQSTLNIFAAHSYVFSDIGTLCAQRLHRVHSKCVYALIRAYRTNIWVRRSDKIVLSVTQWLLDREVAFRIFFFFISADITMPFHVFPRLGALAS